MGREFVVVLVTSLLVMLTSREVKGEGRMIDPAARSTLWRYGISAPINYNDHMLNCGGLYTQWVVNQGKCGVCGDPYDQPAPRDHEGGGLYGKGIIAKNYSPGQTIEIVIEVTANHLGWFEFRLCPHDSPHTPINQQCLDQNVLELASGSGTRYKLTDSGSGQITVKVKLPAGITCSQCVLQWKWHTDNNRAYNDTIQEEFYGCSDISIGAFTTAAATTTTTTKKPAFVGVSLAANSGPPPPSTTTTAATTTKASAASSGALTCFAIGSWQGDVTRDQWCNTNCPTGVCPKFTCQCAAATTTPTPATTTITSPNSKGMTCVAIGMWQGNPTRDQWCNTNCPAGVCPKFTCQCTTPATTAAPAAVPNNGMKCAAIGMWQGDPARDQWCNQNCPTGFCPIFTCQCTSPATTPAATTTTTTPAPTTTTTTTTTPMPTTTTTPMPTTTTAAVTPYSGIKCFGVGTWQGDPSKDIWCTTNCRVGLCPLYACQCTAATAATTTTVATTPAVARPSTGMLCEAVGPWQGDATKTLWCQLNCPMLCPASNCKCTYNYPAISSPFNPITQPPPPTTTTTTPKPTTATAAATTTTTATPYRCHGIGQWAGQLRYDQLCSITCPFNLACNLQYCSCPTSPAGPQFSHLATQVPLFTTQPPPPFSVFGSSTGRRCKSLVGAVDLDQWCQGQCNGGSCPVAYCSCRP